MRQHYAKIVKDTEKRVEYFLKKQIRDETAPIYGGLEPEAQYIDPVKATIFYLANLGVLYFTPQSRFYKDSQSLERIRQALSFVNRRLRPDGTFDFIKCNFFSPPDTAFYLNRLIFLYRIITKYGIASEHIWLKEQLYQLIEKTGYGISQGMAQGGFHTPNHRWAIAAALTSCFKITGIDEFEAKAARYLNEGIDCNATGEYTERSAGNYNVVNNEQMLILFMETGDEQYLGPVRRNLAMSLNYIEPDGSVFTGNSNRWDYGMKKYPDGYYYQYLYMDWKCNIPEFAAAAAKIMDDLGARGDLAPDCLDWYLLYPELVDFTLEPPAIPEDYEAFYPESGIVRVRRHGYSFSLLRDKSRFLYFQAGALEMYMKIGVSYFNQREFCGQFLERIAGGYRLIYKSHGRYYLPFEEKPPTSDWDLMGREMRPKIIGPDLDIVVTVTEVESGIDVNILTSGCDRVPTKIEMAVTAGAWIQTDAFYCHGSAGEAIIVKEGTVEAALGLDTIQIGPAFAGHGLVVGNFDDEARSRNHFTVYFTDYTNFSRTITIKADQEGDKCD